MGTIFRIAHGCILDQRVLQLSLLMLVVGITQPVLAQTTIEGHWEGALIYEGAMQVIRVDLQETGDTIQGWVDIPDLTLFREPLQEAVYDPDSLKLSFKIIYGTFSLVVHPDIHEMTGENGWKTPAKLHLRRQVKRLEYQTEDVVFESEGASLAGTFVVPERPGPHPTVVILHGSGPSDRTRWAYRSRGDMFARHGIAALIYDKRGYNESTGDTDEITFDDLANDAVAAVRYLRTRDDVRTDRIGMYGSSQGGWISMMSAAQSSNIAFLVLNVTPAVSVYEQEAHWVEYHMRADDFSEESIVAAVSHTRLMFEVVTTGRQRETFLAASREVKQEKWAEYVYTPVTEEELGELITDWQGERYDPTEDLKRTILPVLALYGENDKSVPPRENVDKMQAYLAEAGNTDITIKVFPGVGHNMEAKGFTKEEDSGWPSGFYVWPRRVPGWEETIITWVQERVGMQAR